MKQGVRRLAVLVPLVPALMLAGAGLGWLAQTPLSRLHPAVQQAERVWADERGDAATVESRAFAAAGTPSAALYAAAESVRRQMRYGGTLLGAFLGLCLGGKLVALSVRRTRRDYEPDRSICLSCGRCFSFCPREKLRRRPLRPDTRRTDVA